MGADAIGALFDEVVDLAAGAWELLEADPRFEVVTRSAAEHVVFRYLPGRDRHATWPTSANLYAREALAASGEAVVAGTNVDGRHYLKFTLLNPETTLEDIAQVLDLIVSHAGSTWRPPRLRASRPNRRATLSRCPHDPLGDPAPRIHDFIAIGLGPLQPGPGLPHRARSTTSTALFLEARDEFDWHPGMLLERPPCRRPFMADLVTLADPTSPYSFLNYLKETGRLYPFYIRESFYPLRAEYNDVLPVGRRRSSATCASGTEVTEVTYDEAGDCTP